MKAGKRPRTLLWQIYPAFFAITLMVVISAGWYFMSVLKNYQDADYLDSLQARAALLEPQVEEELRRANYARLQQLSVRAGEQTNTRVTIITPEGTVVAESHEDPARLENHALRPEMATALKGEDGVSQRYSRSVSKNMLYFARPIRVESGEIIGVVRTAIATDRIDERIAAVGQRLISGGVAVLLLVALLCLV
ncbi:MAG: PAS domain-containing sensor histidine kinase, partial [Desulfuromonadaceae bacterium]